MVSPRPSGLLLKKLKASWQKAFLRLFPLGGISTHNHVHIIHEGDTAFLAIEKALDGAKQSIYVETYILAADQVGQMLKEALLNARSRGVLVTLIYDHLGSTGLSNGFIQSLKDAGVTVLAFNPIWPWRRRGPLLFRDHRKIIVIDESMAFCGGMNLSADYAGKKLGNNRFRDSIAFIKGPAVKDLLLITLESIAESKFSQKPELLMETLEYCIDKTMAFRAFLQRLWRDDPDERVLSPDHGCMVQVLRSNMRRNLSHIQKSLEECVNRSVSYCYFTTPYFLPHEGLRRAMLNAAKRGVDVRILTAGLSDVPLMRYASRHVYAGFLTHGIRIYEMTEKTLHAKLVTIDGLQASIGSYNLDHWSARRNLEVNLSIIDQGIAQGLKEQFHKDLALGMEIQKEEFLKRGFARRLWCWLAYLLMRL